MKLHAGGFILAVLGATWAFEATAQDAATVVAKVNDTEITLGHLAALRAQLPAQYQQLPADVLFRGLLDQVIQQTALSQDAAKLITKRDELTLENDRRAYLAGLALQESVKAAITDEAIQAAYDARFATAEPGTEYNAAHILVKTEEEAAKLKTEIEGGADFAELARQHSTDGAAAGGGSLGWFGPGMMVKPFEDAVVALKAGEIGGPIQTQFGWHLIKLNETRVAEAPALEAVREELVAELEQAAVEARIKAATDGVTVIRSDEGVDPALLNSPTLFGN
ncbi:peptidyl-prolyl cis-trans isomerase C [Gemmobacter megaterium]|uniref:Parvulin-like PPIase n=1 Tax=Gemmobacter megaterium TaxID=1086013 RepID=A0A1N7NZN8_9RHOB|nr:peptidylprolyl isomerase [Gemmobacter megaterium]GGE15610.1 peptidylprolyl isomerase [Gemmobacter megaterium]SIT03679.1 peptidyl-prolyl cis-trans isomerase C [Gemmobacter megaterium]